MSCKHITSIAITFLMLCSVSAEAADQARETSSVGAVAQLSDVEKLIKKLRFKDAQIILERVLAPYIERQQLSSDTALEIADLLVVSKRDQSLMQEALELAQKTYDRSEQTLGKNDLQTLRRFKTLAEIKLRMSTPDAYQMYVDLINRTRLTVSSQDVFLARALAEAAEAAMVIWAPAAADQYLVESIQIFTQQKTQEPVDLVYLQSLVAAHMRWRGDFMNAKLMGEKALQSVKNLNEADPIVLGRVLLNNGHVYSAAGDNLEGLKYFKSAYETLSNALGNKHFYTLDALRNMALEMLSIGEIEQAKTLINDSMSFASEAYGSDTLYLAGWLVDYAKSLMRISRYEDALRLLKRAESIALLSLKETYLPVAYGFELLAECHAALGQFDQELIYREKSHRAYERTLGPNNYLTLYRKNGLANTYYRLGQYQVSAQMYKDLSEAYRTQFGERSENYANVVASWSRAQANVDRSFDPKPYLEQSLNTLEAISTDSSISVIRLKLHLAFAYMSADEDKRALAMLAEVKKYALGADLVSVYEGESQLYRKLGDSDQAYASASDAINLSEELSSQLLTQSGAALNMSVVLQATGDLRGAIYWAKSNVNLLQDIRSRVKNIGQQELQSYTESVTWSYQWLAFLLIQENRLPEAQHVLEMLKEEEQFQFIRRRNSAVVDRTRITYTPFEAKWIDQQRRISENIISITKEKAALEDRIKMGLQPREFNRLKNLEEDLKQARKTYREFLSDLRQAMIQRGPIAEQDVLELTLKSANETKSLIKKLGPDVVLVQYFVTDQSVNMLLTTEDAQVARSISIKLSELNLKVAAFRRALRDPKVDPVPIAKVLYEILVKPIEGDLNQANARKVMLSLTGSLAYIPFGALHDGTDYIVKRWRLPIYTTVTKAKLLDPVNDKWTAVGLGLTRKVGDFSPLPAVKNEIQSIVNTGKNGILPGEIYLDEAFTAMRLRDVSLRKFDVLHIASHFRLSPGTEVNSFLLLGDGKELTLGEIREGNYRFDNVDLLTLSACDTGLGGGRNEKGQEIEGFGVMAQIQGAKSVLATLWTVDDKSTSLLMTDMYKRRQLSGLTKIDALSESQNSLMSIKEYSHPFFWAPFILMGNWR